MVTIETLLKENTGLLSRMKTRDGNILLNEVLNDSFKQELIEKKS